MSEDISNGTKAVSGEGNGIRRECTEFIDKTGLIDCSEGPNALYIAIMIALYS